MKRYNKANIKNSKLQIGTDFEENIFLRFNDTSGVVDLMVGSKDTLKGLQASIEKYLEAAEIESENKVVH